eukprot:4877335-Pyramimonas_sp.AAC.1
MWSRQILVHATHAQGVFQDVSLVGDLHVKPVEQPSIRLRSVGDGRQDHEWDLPRKPKQGIDAEG